MDTTTDQTLGLPEVAAAVDRWRDLTKLDLDSEQWAQVVCALNNRRLLGDGQPPRPTGSDPSNCSPGNTSMGRQIRVSILAGALYWLSTSHTLLPPQSLPDPDDDPRLPVTPSIGTEIALAFLRHSGLFDHRIITQRVERAAEHVARAMREQVFGVFDSARDAARTLIVVERHSMTTSVGVHCLSPILDHILDEVTVENAYAEYMLRSIDSDPALGVGVTHIARSSPLPDLWLLYRSNTSGL